MVESEAQYVRTRPQLNALLDEIGSVELVGLDTEFVSEGSYEPILCLVQIATVNGIWIVDPYAVSDLQELWTLVTAPEREMIALAAREEIRFCLRGAGRPPARLFDPQLAAGLVGYGYPLSHTNLVRKALGVRVQGGESFTDWRQRPLSAKQLEYAADDVRHLIALRRKIMGLAEERGRTDWIEGECRKLVERVVTGETEERWRRVSGSTSLGRRELAVLRELWRWRDQEARRANQPPRRILRDELLVEIAKRRPTTTADLYALRGLDRGAIRNGGPDVVAAVQLALKVPDAELPTLLRRDDPPQVSILGQLLSVAANSLAEEHAVDPALLATTSDLQDLVRWELGLIPREPQPAILEGWRGEILGQPLREVLEGKRTVRVTSLKSPSPLAFDPRPRS